MHTLRRCVQGVMIARTGPAMYRLTLRTVTSTEPSLHRVLGEDLLHYAHFGGSGLPLVRSSADTDVGLNPDNAFRMQHRVCLTDDFHDLIPRSFYQLRQPCNKRTAPVVGTRENARHAIS